ncbi:hypothetical protein ACP8Y2_07685 [Herpetosiphon llansteffanensis]
MPTLPLMHALVGAWNYQFQIICIIADFGQNYAMLKPKPRIQ